jgi:hypothetical protein
MSSHREAPEISKDPVADSTDVYAFVSPDRPDTVTLIANYIPLQDPASGPNFFEFGDDVAYRINIDTSGDGRADIVYELRFTTNVENPGSFLYNTGPITTLDSTNWNRRQRYRLTEIRNGRRRILGDHLASPPCNVGARSTPNYAALATSAVNYLDGGISVFAGQRLDAFFVDLGSIFDLGTLRPFQNLHLISTPAMGGVNALRAVNVHTIALQVPIERLTAHGGRPTDPHDPKAVIGVWTTASRQRGSYRRDDGSMSRSGNFVQISRLGNPLFNEVIVPMGDKDRWNATEPRRDNRFAKYVAQPELAKLLPVLYPGVFPNLAAYTADRADLLAILLTGIPQGIVPGFQNFTGGTQADMLRLNVAIPPSATPNRLGLVGGDAAGFPNGRRVTDDVVTIELRAVAGATIPLVDPSFTPDGAAALIEDGTAALNDVTTLPSFPYLDHPVSGTESRPLSKAS